MICRIYHALKRGRGNIYDAVIFICAGLLFHKVALVDEYGQSLKTRALQL